MNTEAQKFDQGTEETSPQRYVAETPPELLDSSIIPETRQEILNVVTERGWEQAKRWFSGREAQRYGNGGLPIGFLEGAVSMHEFDPVRFCREVPLDNDDWESFRKGAWREGQESIVHYAAMLKHLDPERFEQTKPINDKDLQDVFRSISSKESISEWDLFTLKVLIPERLQQLTKSERFRTEQWPAMKERLKRSEAERNYSNYESKTIELLLLRAFLQELRPAGEPPFNMKRQELDVLKQKLAQLHNYGDPDETVRAFYFANAASRLRIE